MNKNQEKEISKKLSYVLRHQPDAIGIELDEQGWTDISILIDKMNITREELEYVVEHNSKKRFSIDEANNKIRANQGHSIAINLGLSQKTPPDQLYHGTAQKHYDIIATEGLKKMSRNHVHLSADIETAKQVGSRHGKPIILIIDCKQMLADGASFYQADNGVWLTEYVGVEYIRLV